ncbi:MAG: hypothetical protein RR625_07170, partial [Christensenellaceae bacterium]
MKKISVILIALTMCFSLVACSPTSNESSVSTQPSEIPVETERSLNESEPNQPDESSIGEKQPSNETSNDVVTEDTTTYQTVLDEYTEKLENATPALIDEYNAEAATNTEGLEGLATISNAKVAELAEISMEGVGKMASIYLETGSGKSSEY